jgi:hypothetical protein
MKEPKQIHIQWAKSRKPVIKTEEQLLKEIKDYQGEALQAYKNRDFNYEAECDRQIAMRKDELEQRFKQKSLTAKDLTPHTWDAKAIQQFGDARCKVCGQKQSYYNEGMANLSQWSDEEKHTRKYNQAFLMFDCKGR